MPENEQRIFGRGGFHPTRQSPPVLLYTPDGVTLRSRWNHAAYGTLTQYERFEGEYQWLYTSCSNPQIVVMRPRVWIIDPMPEADALALARAICNAETAAKRFADFCAGWGVRKLDEMSAGTGEESGPCFSESLRVVFENTHQHHIYGSDHGAAIRAFEEAADVAVKALESRLSEELDRVSKALESIPPMGDPSYDLATAAQ